MSLVKKGLKYSLQVECCLCSQARHNGKGKALESNILFQILALLAYETSEDRVFSPPQPHFPLYKKGVLLIMFNNHRY